MGFSTRSVGPSISLFEYMNNQHAYHKLTLHECYWCPSSGKNSYLNSETNPHITDIKRCLAVLVVLEIWIVTISNLAIIYWKTFTGISSVPWTWQFILRKELVSRLTYFYIHLESYIKLSANLIITFNSFYSHTSLD